MVKLVFIGGISCGIQFFFFSGRGGGGGWANTWLRSNHQITVGLTLCQLVLDFNSSMMPVSCHFRDAFGVCHSIKRNIKRCVTNAFVVVCVVKGGWGCWLGPRSCGVKEEANYKLTKRCTVTTGMVLC